MPIRYLSGLSVDSTVLVVDAANDRVGIGTATPGAKLHVIGDVVGGIGYNGGFYADAGTGSGIDVNWGFDFSKTVGLSDYSTRVKFYSAPGEPRKLGFWDARTSSYMGYFDGSLSVPNFIIPAGNVGIGTTAPGSKLEVSGGLAHFAQTATTGSAFRWGSYGTAVSPDTMLCMNQLWNGSGWTILNASYGTTAINLGSAEASPTMQFQTGGANTSATTKMIILNNGNVGIGTTAPQYKLDVVGGDFRIMNTAGPILNFSDNVDQNWDIGVDATTNDFYFKNGISGVRHLTIDDGGNVGIGNTSPGGNLDVQGASTTNVSYFRTNGAANRYILSVQNIENTAAVDFRAHGSTYSETLFGNSCTNASMIVGQPTSGAVFAIGNVNNGPLVVGTNNAERMRITAAGNVGIGTTSPTQLLHILGANAANNGITIQNTNASGNSQVRFLNTAGTEKAAITYVNSADAVYHYIASGGNLLNLVSGNVGIGTTAPAHKLEVQGTIFINADGDLLFDNTSGGAGFQMDYFDGQMYFGNQAGSSWHMVMKDNGNVGIGTTSPQGNLEVVGLSYFTRSSQTLLINPNYSGLNTHTQLQVVGNMALAFATNGDNERMRITSAGNVGIGITSPNSKLEVAGNIRLGNTLDNTQRFIGRGDANSEVSSNGGSIGFISTTTEDHLTFNTHKSGVSQGERMRITSTGNVLIGTTADTPLSTARGIVINSGASNDAQIRLQNNTTGSTGSDGALFSLSGTGVYLWNYENDAIFFGTNNSTRITITSAGNVGIGTTSPGAKLHVYTPSSGTAIVVGRASGNSSIKASADADGGYLSLDSTGTATIINHYVSDNVWLVTGGGNVGIGTTAPFSRLTVSGALTSSASQISIVNTEGGHAIIRSGIAGVSNNGISFITAAVDGTSQVNNMVIDASGEVGIGTTQPMGPLEVYKSNSGGLGGHIILNNNGLAVGNETAILFGDSGVGSANGIRAAISSTVEGAPYRGDIKFKTGVTTYGGLSTTMIITGAGNVGIGTTAPAAKLHVNPATVNEIAIAINGTQNYSANSFQRISAGDASSLNRVAIGFGYNSTPEWTIRYSSYHNHEFFTGNDWGSSTEKMRITSAGNVGIGTTAPKSKLQIVGPTLTTNNENTYALWVSDTGDDTKGLLLGYDLVNDVGVIQAVDQATSWKSISIASNGGNVSIGTTTNTGARTNIFLSEAGATPNAILRLQNTGSQYLAKMILTDGNTNDAVIGYQGGVTSATQYLGFGLGTAITQMILTAAGNVGIGTTSPAQKLDVEGSVRATGGGFEPSTSAWINAAFTTKINGSPYGGGLALIDGTTGWAQYTIGSGANLVFAYGATSGATSEKMRITSAGNVGIGTTAPGHKLEVNGGTIGNSIARFTTGAGGGGTRGMTITSNDSQVKLQVSDNAGNVGSWAFLNLNPDGGDVGIGTTGPTEKLHVDGSTLITYNNSFQSTNSVGNKAILARVSPTSGIVNYAEYATATNLNGFVIGSDDARVKGNITGDSLEFITNTSTRMTILSGGNVGINTTTPGSTLHVIGDVLIQTGALGVGVNPNATDGRIDASNDIVAFSTSDRRLKENITPIANALEKVRSLTGVEFDWKEETKSVHGYEGHDVGVIAQDVQAVLPEAVRTNDSGYLSVRYEKMIALLVEANKELADRVEQLEKLIK